MTESSMMTIEELESEILKAKAWKVEGLTLEELEMMDKMMKKREKKLKARKQSAGMI